MPHLRRHGGQDNGTRWSQVKQVKVTNQDQGQGLRSRSPILLQKLAKIRKMRTGMEQKICKIDRIASLMDKQKLIRRCRGREVSWPEVFGT